MKLFTFLLRTYRWSVLAVLIISLLSGVVNTALLGLINQQLTTRVALTTSFTGYFVGLVLLTIVFDLLAKNLLSSLTGWTSYHLRMNLARQILATPLVRLETLGAPRLLAILTDDIRSIAHLLASLPALAIGLVTVLGAIVYLGWLSPIALAVLIGLAVPTILLHRLLLRKAHAFSRQGLSERDGIFHLYRALVEGVKELQLHAPRRQAFLQDVLEPTAANVKKSGMAARRWHHLANTWSQSAYFVFVIAILLLSRWQALSVEVMTGYALIVLYLKGSIMAVLQGIPLWTEANIAMQRIEEDGFAPFFSEMKSEKGPLPPIQPTPPASAQITLTLKDVTYHYQQALDEAGFTLGPLHLTLQAGELVFIRGDNGSGKTTLVKLLTGLYRPDSGHIYWNGAPVCAENLEAYRQNFTTIFAEPFLFEQLLGVEQVDLDQQAEHYLAQLRLDHKVCVVNGHFSTTALSHGQRKRLALLTAYLEDRPVYIFDEWAAGQDPEFRELFYRTFLPALTAQGKLVIVISHDEHYFDVADRLLTLDMGQLEADR